MEIKIKIEDLVGIDLHGYFLCFCLLNNNSDELLKYCDLHKIPTESFQKLIDNNYLSTTRQENEKFTLSNIILLTKFKERFFPTKIGPEGFIDQWFELFPKGVRSGGLPIKTDKPDCLKKMIKFCKEYPDYTRGIIITATQKYLSEMKQKNYAYCKLAPYLIYKDGMSMLSGLCQGVYESVTSDEISDENKEQGKTIRGATNF